MSHLAPIGIPWIEIKTWTQDGSAKKQIDVKDRSALSLYGGEKKTNSGNYIDSINGHNNSMIIRD